MYIHGIYHIYTGSWVYTWYIPCITFLRVPDAPADTAPAAPGLPPAVPVAEAASAPSEKPPPLRPPSKKGGVLVGNKTGGRAGSG